MIFILYSTTVLSQYWIHVTFHMVICPCVIVPLEHIPQHWRELATDISPFHIVNEVLEFRVAGHLPQGRV